MARSWYSYGAGDVRVASSYYLSLAKPTCVNGPNICAIYAFGLSEQPLDPLSANLQRYINAASIIKIAQPQGLGVKRYIYLRE